MTTGLTEVSDADLATALLIRQFEELTLELVAAGEIHGTTHTCLGQEYVAVAMQGLKTEGDHVLSNHRGHGHFLAHTDDPASLMAELLGVAGAVSGGRGGSQHVHARGYYSTGVQGQNVAIGAGIALRYKKDRPGDLVIVHIGDGTWGEGAVYEALNMAALWALPLVVVVENNGIAQSTPTSLQMAGSVEARARSFGIPFVGIDHADIARIRRDLSGPLHRTRNSAGPLVVEFRTTRLGPHSKGDDTRSEADLETLRADDWLGHYTEQHRDQVRRVDPAVRTRIAEMMHELKRRTPVR